MKEEQQYFWVWYGFFAMCFIIWLVCAYPELVAPFVACLAFFLASVVVIVGVAHAFQEGPAPEPQKGWIGAVMAVRPVEVERIMSSKLTIEEKTEWLDRYGVLYTVSGSNIEITYQPAGRFRRYEVEVWTESGQVIERRVPERKEKQLPARPAPPSRRERVNKELERQGLRPRNGYKPAHPLKPGAGSELEVL